MITRLKALFSKKRKAYNPNNLEGYLTDTNVLLNKPSILEQYKCFIPSHVLREIEHLELTRKQDNILQHQIRRFKAISDETVEEFIDLEDYKFNLRKEWDKAYVDNLLVQICLDKNLGMITNDRLLRKKCKLYGIVVINPSENSEYVEHKGFKVADLSQTQLNNLRDNMSVNYFDLMVNEYCIVNDVVDGDLLDILKWDGTELKSLKTSTGRLGEEVQSFRFPKISPKDEYQAMVIDSIRTNQVTSVRGRAGSGKSLLALYTAWQLVEKEGYKLVVFVNPVDSKDAQSLGYYKGDKLSKLLQSSAGSTLTTKFGDEFTIMQLIEEGTMEIQPFANLRGYDTGDNKVVVWILEAQNLTSELLKLGLQRIGENTKVIIDGDFHQQIDMKVYESENGMMRMSEVLRGIDLYGEIELQNVYRSRLADLVDAM